MARISQNNLLQTAVLGGGCFWCLEALFSKIKGVSKVVSGYAGGETNNPSYKEVSSGKTGPASTRGGERSSTRGGHAETVEITFNPEIISYEDLLNIFFLYHDPTTLNRQGNDVGTQYRSIILYKNDTQRKIAKKVKKEIEEKKIYHNPIVTEIKPLQNFYPGEDYHQKYFEKNPENTYCQIVIAPHLAEFKKFYAKFF